MMPPSRRLMPGSSTMARSKRSTRASKVSTFASACLSIEDFAPFSFSRMPGRQRSEIFSAMRSRALAVPTSMRVRRRSKSWISRQPSRTPPRSEKSPTSSPTASRRCVMPAMLSKGYSSHFFKRRLPIAVSVKSRTSRSVFFLPPSRRLRVISRLRSVYVSTTRFSEASRYVSWLSCVRSVRTVSWR